MDDSGPEFRLLGPLEVRADGRIVPIGSPKHRGLLATLVLSNGGAVPVTRLIDVLWTDNYPAAPRRAIQLYVTRLRKQFADAGVGTVIETRGDGYGITIPPHRTDVGRFRALLADARAAGERGDWEVESATLREALAQWRGEPLADISSEPLYNEIVPVLLEQRWQALEARIDADLRLGRHRDLVGELRGLAARAPSRERLWTQLITALHRNGQRTDALNAFQTIRHHLAENLGIDPGEELQRLHTEVILGSAGRSWHTIGGLPVPRQLPPDVPSFTGRTAQLRWLDALIPAGPPDQPPKPVTIAAISGAAGVGKSTLVAHWTRRVADRFPDGQLWINLRGYHSEHAISPDKALPGFLRALGVPGPQVPADAEDQSALFRTLMDGRRMLVVLDNANGTEQVRPLLPGSPGCVVIVTSRSLLSGLITSEGAHSLSVDLLPADEARQLLIRRLGADRPAADSAAIDEIIRRCAGLPLALALVAARAAAHPEFPLAALANELAEAADRLSAFAAGDAEVDIRTVFSWSYRRLADAPAELFRLLSLHPPCADVGISAAASITGIDLSEARRRLAELSRAHLLIERKPARYVFHDLLRAYARELTDDLDPEATRNAARRRMIQHYLHNAAAAVNAAYPYDHLRRPPTVAEGAATDPTVADPARALTWLDTELPNLLAAVQCATNAGWPGYAVHLSAVLRRHLRTRGRYADAETLHTRALTHARNSDDRQGQIDALIGLGDIHRLHRRHSHARNCFTGALVIAGADGQPIGEVDALTGLGHIDRLQGRYELAAAHLSRALPTAQAIGYSIGEMEAHRGLGWVNQFHGHYDDATEAFSRSLDIARDLGHHIGEMDALRGLGWMFRVRGRHDEAIDSYAQALSIARRIGDRTSEVDVMRVSAHIYRASGRYERAAEYSQQVLDISRATGYRTSELDALLVLGHVHRARERYGAAADCFRRLLEISGEIDNRNALYEAVQGLGRVYHGMGRPDRALTNHRRALKLANELGNPGDRVRAHDGLAHAHRALRHHERARHHWQHALDLLETLGVDTTEDEEANAAAIRAALQTLPGA